MTGEQAINIRIYRRKEKKKWNIQNYLQTMK